MLYYLLYDHGSSCKYVRMGVRTVGRALGLPGQSVCTDLGD